MTLPSSTPVPAADASGASDAAPDAALPHTSTSGPAAQGASITVLAPPSTSDPASTAKLTTTSPSSTGTTEPTTTSASRTNTTSTTSPANTSSVVDTTRTAPTAPIVIPAGTVVVIDPGHNGANAKHPEIINKQVPAGFGQFKACNTTGTATNAGYPEHEFTWNVANALRKLLQNKGITVVMTRDSDTGVGPCVNDRAGIGNQAHAAAVISIHGDGEAAGVRGFYVMTAARAPAGPAITAGTEKLALDVRNGMAGVGFPISNTLGSDGLWQRSDLAGLNLSLRPTIMIECGNMRNASEAATMSSAAGQQKYAEGIAAGVEAFLGR